MAWLQVVARSALNDRARYTCLSGDTKITDSTIFEGDTCKETDGDSSEFEYDGDSWKQTDVGGNALVSTSGAPGTVETRTFTIGADGDCFTDPTAPAIAELITGDTFTAGKKRCRVTYHADQGVPFASMVLVTLNAGDDSTAQARLTYVDVTAGGTGSVDTLQRSVSRAAPVIEYDLTGTAATVDRIDMGGILDAGSGAGVVYITAEVW